MKVKPTTAVLGAIWMLLLIGTVSAGMLNGLEDGSVVGWGFLLLTFTIALVIGRILYKLF